MAFHLYNLAYILFLVADLGILRIVLAWCIWVLITVFALVFITGCLCFLLFTFLFIFPCHFSHYSLVWVAFSYFLGTRSAGIWYWEGQWCKKFIVHYYSSNTVIFAGRSGMVGLGSRDVVIPFSGLPETNTTSPVLIGVSLLFFYFLFFSFYLITSLLHHSTSLLMSCI